MTLHRRARLRHRSLPNGLKNLGVLFLEGIELLASRGRLSGFPDGPARNNESAEVFQKTIELRIAGCFGDRTMESEILVDAVFAAVDGRLNGVKPVCDFLDLRRRGAFRGKTRRLYFHTGAQLHDIEHFTERRLLVEIDPEWAANLTGDKCAHPLPGYDQPIRPQCRNRFADNGAANPGRGNHFLFGRQSRTRGELSARDVRGQPSDHLGGQPTRSIERLQQAKIFWTTLGQRLDISHKRKVII
ncbi:MAG TPA: hypothetical protein VFO74_15485 [Pseudolabrys sp.]|nr:hypothetical protein [Pseudolabrys sp.]